APRTGGELGLATEGALARAPMALPDPLDAPEQAPSRITPADALDGRIVPTGFAALDAILGPGGLPRTASVALQGDHSSGKTTLALRLAAEAQSAGLIVGGVAPPRHFNPVEAVPRGIRPEWLVV